MRRPWIDWLRGLAVVIMFHAHTIDSWTRAADRHNWWYYQSVRVSGMAAPLFLFLAGVAVVMASNAQARRGTPRAAASWALQKRGWEIFGIAILFRAQSWIFNPGATFTGLLKIDILNVMGPSMVLAAWLWGQTTRDNVRLALYTVLAFGIVAASPFVRETPLLAGLPEPIQWYLRPPTGKGWFAIFPWTALLIAGAAVGVIIDRARDAAAERRLAGVFAAAGAAIFALGLTTSYFPPLVAGTTFWTTSLSYFIIRIGLMLFLLAFAYAWMARPGADPATSPMIQMGRTSLFLYWVHVELAYGVLSYPIKNRMPFWSAMVAFVAFSIAMLWLSYFKDRIVSRWNASGTPPVQMARA